MTEPKHVFDSIEIDRPATTDLFGANTRKWRVVYADPPWQFNNRSELGEDRNANQYYDTMPIEEIMGLPVQDIVEDDAVLFMWATDPTLAQAMHVITSWGFEYKTVFYWNKIWPAADLENLHYTKSFPIGTGYIGRGNVEPLLVATRGEPRRRLHKVDGILKPDMSIRRQQFAPRGQHSQKPPQFRAIIEKLYNGPYLELFSRTRTPGWGVWGNQVGGLDDGTAGIKKKPAEKPIAAAPLFD